MSKITWMCAECAQDFTRRPSAVRHNTNLHYGKARLVRFVDYVIGRITGEFWPANPSLFRGAKRKLQKPSGLGKNGNRVPLTTAAADANGDELRCGNAAKPLVNSSTAKPDHNPFDLLSQTQRKEDDGKLDSFDRLLQVSPKLAEVKLLLRPHLPPELIQWIVRGWHLHIVTSGSTNQFYDYVDWIPKYVKLKEALS